MTVTFQGHVEALEAAAPAQVVVKLRTPMDPAGGHEMALRLPAEEAKHWLPGTIVQFTIYTLAPRDHGLNSGDLLSAMARGGNGA